MGFWRALIFHNTLFSANSYMPLCRSSIRCSSCVCWCSFWTICFRKEQLCTPLKPLVVEFQLIAIPLPTAPVCCDHPHALTACACCSPDELYEWWQRRHRALGQRRLTGPGQCLWQGIGAGCSARQLHQWSHPLRGQPGAIFLSGSLARFSGWLWHS